MFVGKKVAKKSIVGKMTKMLTKHQQIGRKRKKNVEVVLGIDLVIKCILQAFNYVYSVFGKNQIHKHMMPDDADTATCPGQTYLKSW